jgi:hypothetical protein
MNPNQIRRRRFLKFGGATLAMIPMITYTGQGVAATNAAVRSALKYQDKPEGEKHCANCLQFLPGKSAKDKGGCKIMPGDTEISPQGYCTAWAKK